ncbi:MAG: hypothetical protein M3132_13420 [Actinomycetia bacterium]|nr:hypothetical protein [Actinomycetes bacterium]
MSPRAACRLEAFGFERVFDYTLGIADWRAAGLPIEGKPPTSLVVSDATRGDIPTSQLDEPIGDVLARTSAAGWEEALVLDCGDVVVGRLRGSSWEHDPGTPVSTVMELGPTTVRPNTLLEPLVERMEGRGTSLVVVSTPQGALVGVMIRTEARRLIQGEPSEQIWLDCEGCPGRWKTL